MLKRSPKVSQKPKDIHIKPISFVFDYEPTPKGTPKVVFFKGKARTYYHKNTMQALTDLRAILTSMNLPLLPKHIPLKVTYIFYRTKGKWLPRYEQLPCRKPDTENYEKLVSDVLCPILVPDDAQFTYLIGIKRWSPTGQGYIKVTIEEDLGGEPC
jgi:Holliday junction resolvase RusA-like endonuclease